VKRFRGGLVFKAHIRLHHSTLGSRERKKKNRRREGTSSLTSSSFRSVRIPEFGIYGACTVNPATNETRPHNPQATLPSHVWRRVY